MIAIPNVYKPKKCKECIDDMYNVVVDCYPDDYGEDRDGNKIICPLIEIVQCKDCKWGDTGIDEEGKLFWKCIGIHYGGTKPTDFCSYGERRE